MLNYGIFTQICVLQEFRAKKQKKKNKKKQQNLAKVENEVCIDILQLCCDISCEEYR